MKTKNLLLIAAIVVGLGSLLTSCSKKEGCTDSTAENFNPDADKDDGSCTYEEEETPCENNVLALKNNIIIDSILFIFYSFYYTTKKNIMHN